MFRLCSIVVQRFAARQTGPFATVTRRRIALAACLSLCFDFAGNGAKAAEAVRGVDTPQCKEAISGIVRDTNARFERASPDGDNAFLQHPAATDILLTCSADMPTSVSASWKGAYPPNAYFEFLASSGAVITGERKSKVLQRLRACQLSALKDKDEVAELHFRSIEIDCQAYTRDGGGTSLSVWAKHDDDAPL